MLLRLLLGLVSLIWIACGTEESLRMTDAENPSDQHLRFASEQDLQEERVVPHSYLVAFKPFSANKAMLRGAPRVVAQAHLRVLQESWAQPGRWLSARYFTNLTLDCWDCSDSEALSLPFAPPLPRMTLQEVTSASLMAVEFPDEQTAQSVLTSWRAEGRIYFAEPNYRSTMRGAYEDEIIKTFQGKGLTPWLDQVNFLPALEKVGINGPRSEPIIAVMDSGVDVLHPWLKDVVYRNESGQNKLCSSDLYGCNTTVAFKDVLGNGAVYPSGTKSFGEACPDEKDSGNCIHGTHVAGIIAARGAPNYVGLCPYCKILVVKVVEVESKGGQKSFAITDASILAGLAYVSGFKLGGEPLVRIINASFGKFDRSRSVELFIRTIKNFGRGTLMIGAAGNEDTMKRAYPAAFQDVLAVANVRSEPTAPKKSPSSNFGMWVDISAPGDGECQGDQNGGILSTAPGGGDYCLTGTSMATPVVAGIAGLVLAYEPELTAAQLEQRLMTTATADLLYRDNMNNKYRPSIPGSGLVPLLGSGVVNALGAVDPSTVVAPAVSTKRPDRVSPGCGILGAEVPSPSAWVWFIYGILPSLGIFRKVSRIRRHGLGRKQTKHLP